MKRFYVVLLSILLFSCSNDDDNSQPTLQAAWNLTNVSGGITGLDEDLAKGVVVWDFNTITGMVTIVNNSTNTSVNTLLPSGTYTYNISAHADADILIVNEVDYGRLILGISSFSIEETFADGLTFNFER